MEFTIKQSVLKEELGFIQGVVERKTTIPVLSNILIESIGEQEIRIVGTDLDVTIRCDAEASITKPGAICVQARKLFDIVRALEPGDIKFKKDENEWVKMTCGRSNYRLAGVSREQFPEIPQFKSTPLKLPADVFSYFVQNTAFAITNEQSRFTLSGAKFVIADGTARMVATDGHRLAFIERVVETLDGGDSIDTLIPKKALLELVKISRETGGDVQFGEDQNHLYFETEGHLLITRKLSGTFPNYEMVMPKDNDKSVEFDLAEMRSAVRRMSLVADDRNRSIRMNVSEGQVEITAASSEEGEGSEIVPADYKGEEIQLGFNWQYLLEFLNNAGAVEDSATASDGEGRSVESTAVEGEGVEAAGSVSVKETDGDKVRVREGRPSPRIIFSFKDANAATQMSIAGDTAYNYKYVVMPLRI